jgi:hypothetical protein
MGPPGAVTRPATCSQMLHGEAGMLGGGLGEVRP